MPAPARPSRNAPTTALPAAVALWLLALPLADMLACRILAALMQSAPADAANALLHYEYRPGWTL